MELAGRSSIYKRSESLRSQAGACSCGTCTKRTPSNAARGLAPRIKNLSADPHIRCPQVTSRPLSHPQFSGFSPLSKKFLKIFSPRVPGTVRRALNRRAAPSPSPKTPEFRGKTAHARLAAAPKPSAKRPSGAPKNRPSHKVAKKS